MNEKNLKISDKLTTPGEHLFFFPGQVGKLEAALTVPQNVDNRYIAILGHPHSLHGGTMNNKVVTTMARAFKEVNIASLRFNFRGVEQSEGQYDAGKGESEDMLLLTHYCLQQIPGVQILFAGFSFGSYVAYRAAAQCENKLLLTIAPSVQHYDYKEFVLRSAPWVVVQGDDDEIVPLQSVLDFVADSNPPISLIRFSETGHFFHGKLIDLKECINDIFRTRVRPI